MTIETKVISTRDTQWNIVPFKGSQETTKLINYAYNNIYRIFLAVDTGLDQEYIDFGSEKLF